MSADEEPPVTMPDTTIKYYTTHVKDLVRRYESANVPDLHTLLTDSFPPGPGSWNWDADRAGMPRSC